MKLLTKLEERLSQWLYDRKLYRALKRFGGYQQCPWCKQIAHLYEGTRYDSKTDPTIDALHCGNCGGVSRWRFEMGMIPLNPIGLSPPPVECLSHSDAAYYNALKMCYVRYSAMIEKTERPEDYLEINTFLELFKNNIEQMIPLNKLNRWLGYIQGCLISKGLTTVEEERDWTRPLFRPLDFPKDLLKNTESKTDQNDVFSDGWNTFSNLS